MKGIGDALVMGLIAIIALIIIGVWAACDFFFVEDTYKSKRPIKPDVVIESQTINGVEKSDTTYIYHLK